MSMRTPEGEEKYRQAKMSNNLKLLYQEQPIKEFRYWRVVDNRFPHDKIAKVNHMIVLKREAEGLRHIYLMEWFELLKIIWFIRKDYDTFTYNLPSMSSVKNIPHAHLYKLKREFK